MRKALYLFFASIGLFFYPPLIYAQNKVTGVVTNDKNEPVPDVTVAVKGTSTVTTTNTVGFFSISAVKDQVLVFSSVGYVSREVKVGTGSSVNVVLTTGQGVLGEVIVTTYGTRQNTRNLSYQAQNIKGEEIANTQRDNWINSLSGRVAGANVTPTSGVPGASTSIILRGAISLGGSNSPLFVVDGVPYDNQTLNQENLIAASNASGVGFANRNSDYGNRAADINPEDIESVTILKGPEATALYGSDGASGAIVITTKKGRSGRATVSYDNSFRWEKLYRFPEFQTTYARGANGVSDPNATVNPFAAGAQYAYFGAKYADTVKKYDNIHAFFKTGFTQKHNLNVDGGNEISTYRLSVNFLDQDGVVPTTGFRRFTGRAVGTVKFSPKFNVSSSFAYVNSTTDKTSKGYGGYLMNLLNYPAEFDVHDYQNPDGSRKLYRASSTSLSAEYDNPFWDVYKNPAQDKLDRITTNVTVNLDPTPWLNVADILGIDFYNQTGYYVTNPQSRFGFATNGFISNYEQATRNLNNVFRATARKKFGDFDNTLIVGFANDDNKTRIESQKGERFYEQNFISINNTDPLSRDSKTQQVNDRKVRLFTNYSLNYKNFINFSLAGTREGTSKLNSQIVEKDPYYNFGSISGNIIFTELDMFKNISWLNYGKVRASYGSTGKGPGSAYIIDPSFVSQITTGGGYAYGVTGNNFLLDPEYTTNLELGGEVKLFNSRLSIDITHYELKSKDQIIPARSSYGTGFVLKYFNGGLIENKGWEAIVNLNMRKTSKFSWDVTANFDRNRGEIVEMPVNLPAYYDSDTWIYGNLRTQSYKGASPSNLSGFTVARNTNGDILINPTTGLPISSGDFFTAGDRQPDFRVGLINNFKYKEFTLNFNLDFRKGGDVWNGNEYFLYLTGRSNKSLDREKPVTITGVLNDGLQNTTNPTRSTITVYPYYRSDYFGTTVATETDFIEEVNWMRLRDATLAYTFSRSTLSRQKYIKGASIFVTGTDLFIVTNYTGADPSVNTNNASNRGYGGAGIDFGSLANPRGINVGFKVQF